MKEREIECAVNALDYILSECKNIDIGEVIIGMELYKDSEYCSIELRNVECKDRYKLEYTLSKISFNFNITEPSLYVPVNYDIYDVSFITNKSKIMGAIFGSEVEE